MRCSTIIFLIGLFLFWGGSQALLAQTAPNSRDNTVKPAESNVRFSSEGARKSKKRKWWQKKNQAFEYNRKVREYEDRVDNAVARNQKTAKEMQKPQYSNKSYFGHKRPPKKNPVGKKKFCKECGIVH
jgi:hypothetical protein